VLEGASDQTLVTEICARHGISEGGFAEWGGNSRAGAEHALKGA